MSPTLMTLLLKWAVGLNEVVLPTVLTGAFELSQGDRRGVSPRSGAPAIIRGALGGDKGDSTGGGIRGWRLAWVKEEVVDAGVDVGVEQVSF